MSRAGEILVSVLHERQRVVLISDATVWALHGEALTAALKSARWAVDTFEFAPGDGSKSLDTAGALYRSFAEHRVDRDTVVVALGGGVVSDLAGFVAATWMRGIRWIACPTTLEAQIDAAIGGKTAINIPGGKNLVGAFHPPMLVLIDPLSLSTLPDRDFRAGLAESIKHAAVFSPEFFEWHETTSDSIRRRDPDVVCELIRRNVAIKCGVVQRDPYERTGVRILLNFGHTVGHAIEEAAQYQLRHGECVALGMIAAAHLSEEISGLPAAQSERLHTLIERMGLPAQCSMDIDPCEVLSIARRDKKVEAGQMRLVLLRDFGMPVVMADVNESLVRAALTKVFRPACS